MNNILVIAPHMDDEVLGCGGTIAKHVEKGDKVFVIVVANRAYGHKYNKKMIDLEKNNALAAKKILGYEKLIFLDLPDEQLDNKLIDIIVPIENAIDKLNVNINTVYTCHGNDPHQDHQAVFEATAIIFRSISKYQVIKFYSYETPSSTDQILPIQQRLFSPSKYVNIENFIDKKLDALSKYEKESRSYPHPRSIEGVKIFAKKRGIEVGLKFAESFYILRDLDK